jgi:hypothetical protein
MAALALATASCAKPALLSTDALPVQRVIVYRNGVAYFERAGHVEEDVIRFKMKQAEVGDFLATLAVMERGGSSVRSAAFPLKDEDQDEQGDDAGPKKPRTEDEKKGLEVVALALDGRAHDLRVGYVAESPVWRPSYRLVVAEGGQSELQAWGIVQNLSGEDWRDVKLSLVAGAPVTFKSELGVPVIPDRPTVSDQGEVIAVVPHSETSLRQDNGVAEKKERETARPEKPASFTMNGAPRRAAPTVAAARGRLDEGGGADEDESAAPQGAMMAPAPAPPPPPSREPAISAPRNMSALAAVAVEAGVTRYDLPAPVTVPDRSATMVMLLSRPVPGEAMFLYAPDSVPDSQSHPYRVARFTNATDGVLERGPIAVFERDAFLGQGVVDPLPAGATATVPFAIERSLAVDVDRKYDEQGARVFRIQNGQLWISRDQVTLTHYKVRNGGDKAAKMLVKHDRRRGSTLHDPPAGTDDNVGTGTALVPGTVAPRSTSEILVDERAVERQGADWFQPLANQAVTAYLTDANADRAVVAKLVAAWALRGDTVSAIAERDRLQRASADLSQSTEETRRNLRAIEKSKTADAAALRQKLTARLNDAASKLDDANRKLAEVDEKISENSVRFREAIRDIDLTVPDSDTK